MPTLFHIKFPRRLISQQLADHLNRFFGTFYLCPFERKVSSNGDDVFIVSEPETGLLRKITVMDWSKEDTLFLVEDPPEVSNEFIEAYLWGAQGYSARQLVANCYLHPEPELEKGLPNGVRQATRALTQFTFFGFKQFKRPGPVSSNLQEKFLAAYTDPLRKAWPEVVANDPCVYYLIRSKFYFQFNQNWEKFFQSFLIVLGGSGSRGIGRNGTENR